MTDSEERSFLDLLNDPIQQEQYASIFYCSHPKIDVMLQFEEIRLLLENSHKRCQELVHEIENNEDDFNLKYLSCFRDIAHSMVAVGALAPFVESMFSHSFDYLLSKQYNISFSKHPRWQYAKKRVWDCHYYFNEKGEPQKGVDKGIIEMLDALGIREQFPCNMDKVLAALFAYRNKMFHCGYEWPEEDRKKFRDTVMKECNVEGNEWFQPAEPSGNIWIIYMSDVFINLCMETIKASLTAFGKVFKEVKNGGGKNNRK
jgi:hypothetical protein